MLCGYMTGSFVSQSVGDNRYIFVFDVLLIFWAWVVELVLFSLFLFLQLLLFDVFCLGGVLWVTFGDKR
jgi:hypothetical protein